MTAGAPPSLTICTSPKPACDNRSASRLGAAMHLVAAGRVGPHRLDPHQVLEIVAHRWQHLAHAFDQIAHGLEASAQLRARATHASVAACRRATATAAARRGRVSDSRMATAAAVSPSWVNDTWIVTSARCSAMAPVSRTRGRPHMSVTTSMSRWMSSRQHRPLGEPRARPRLDHRLLGRPPRRQVARRRRTLVRGVATLTGREGFGEHRSRLVDLLGELRNGDQVDPHSDDAMRWPDAYRDVANLSDGHGCRRRRRPAARPRSSSIAASWRFSGTSWSKRRSAGRSYIGLPPAIADASRR